MFFSQPQFVTMYLPASLSVDPRNWLNMITLSRKPLQPYWTIPCFWGFLATSRHLSSFQIGWLILQSSGILEVSKYSVIMLDEAHERTPDICIQKGTIRRTASWWRDKVFKQALHGLISWPSDFPLAETKTGVHQMALIVLWCCMAVFHSCEDDLHRCSVRIAEGCSEARYSDSGMLNALQCDLTWPTYPRKRPELKLIVTSANFSEGSVWRFSRDCTDLELRQPWMLRNSPVGLAFLRGWLSIGIQCQRNMSEVSHHIRYQNCDCWSLGQLTSSTRIFSLSRAGEFWLSWTDERQILCAFVEWILHCLEGPSPLKSSTPRTYVHECKMNTPSMFNLLRKCAETTYLTCFLFVDF